MIGPELSIFTHLIAREVFHFAPFHTPILIEVDWFVEVLTKLHQFEFDVLFEFIMITG